MFYSLRRPHHSGIQYAWKPHDAAFVPRLPSWATRQVVSNLGYTRRGVNVVGRAHLDPSGCQRPQHL